MSTIRLLFCLLYKVGNILAEKEGKGENMYIWKDRFYFSFLTSTSSNLSCQLCHIIKSTFNRSSLVNMPNHLLSALCSPSSYSNCVKRKLSLFLHAVNFLMPTAFLDAAVLQNMTHAAKYFLASF